MTNVVLRIPMRRPCGGISRRDERSCRRFPPPASLLFRRATSFMIRDWHFAADRCRAPRLLLRTLLVLSIGATVIADEQPANRAQSKLDFATDIVPILTKAGCNSGGCHGKSDGRGGFQLSLFGYDPAGDFDSIIKRSRGRRVFPGSPDESLLLRKALAVVPHGGGTRLRREQP